MSASDTPATAPADATAHAETRKLERTMKPAWVFAIALGSAVGWGAFILPVEWLTDGGTAGALIGFAIGTVLMAIIAVSYGLVIRALPVTGGELSFTLHAFGRYASFVVGWFLALAYACIIALNASAMTLVFRQLFPSVMERGYLYTIAGWDIHAPEVVVALAAMVIAGALNARGAALSGRFQFYACVIMMAAVGIILVWTAVLYLQDPVPLYHGFPAEVSPFAAIAVMVAFAPWAFVGFDNVPQAAGEFDFSPKKAMGLIVAAIFASGAIYLTMILVTSVAASHAGGSFDGSVWATADAITAMLGPGGRALVVIAVFMGVITGLNGFTVSASRVLMTMGRARMLPPVLGRVSHRYGTPVVAVAAAILIASPSPFFGRSALLWIVDMTSVGVTVAYFVTCLVAFTIAEEDGWLPGRTKLAKVIAIVGAVLSVGFLLLLIVPGSPGALATEPLIALAAWVVMGIVFFVLRKPAVDEMPEKELEQVILEG